MMDDKGPGSGGKKEKWVDMSCLEEAEGRDVSGKKGQVAQSLILGVWERVVLCSKEGLSLWRWRKELLLDSGLFRRKHRSGGHVMASGLLMDQIRREREGERGQYGLSLVLD